MVARYVNEGLSRIHMPGFRMQQPQTTHAVGVRSASGIYPITRYESEGETSSLSLSYLATIYVSIRKKPTFQLSLN